MHELKKAIQDASSILIILPDSASDKDYLASLELQKFAPDKTLILAPEEKENAWHESSGNPGPKKEFAITVDTNISPVEELRYEKGTGTLVIYLAHKHRFNKAALSFGEHVPAADLLVTVGFKNREEAEHAIESLPRKEPARHMWLDEYEKKTGQEKITPSSAGLLGRLMVRSREDSDLDALWSFITKEDFTKTSATPEDIPELIRSFARIAQLPRMCIIFWQFNEAIGTEGLLWSENLEFLKEFAERLGTPSEGPFVLLGPFANFIDAETQVRKLLRRGA